MKKKVSIKFTILIASLLLIFQACDTSVNTEDSAGKVRFFADINSTEPIREDTLRSSEITNTFYVPLPELNLTKEGFIFAGWSPDKAGTECFLKYYTCSEKKDLNFYAIWKKELLSLTERKILGSDDNNEINPGEEFSIILKFENTNNFDLDNVNIEITGSEDGINYLRDENTENFNSNYKQTIEQLRIGKSVRLTLYGKVSASITKTTELYINYKITTSTSSIEGTILQGQISFPIAVKGSSIPSSYWGTWISLDDEEKEISINGYEVKASGKIIQKGIYGYTLENDYILKKDKVYYVKKGGKPRKFSFCLQGYEGTGSADAIPLQYLKIQRENINNSADKETVTADSNGMVNFTNAVADDTQKITIWIDNTSLDSDSPLSKKNIITSFNVTPHYYGEFLGTIPIIEKNSSGFKTTYSITGDSNEEWYGNSYKEYELKLNFNNAGDTTCDSITYELSSDDSNLYILQNSTGSLQNIEAGKSKSAAIKIKYGTINDQYTDVPLKIKITDSKTQKTWNDSVSIRFYKGITYLDVGARVSYEKSELKLKGFFIFPEDGHSKLFSLSKSNKVSTREGITISLPWSENDYYLGFTNISNQNCVSHGFRFLRQYSSSGLYPDDLQNSKRSNNDKLETAVRKEKDYNKLESVLDPQCFGYYILNNSFVKTLGIPVEIKDIGIKEADTPKGNGDNEASPGETLYMDILLKNISEAEIKNFKISISSKSNYVNILQNAVSWNSIEKGLTVSTTGEEKLFSGAYTTTAFKFSVAENCPDGETLPFELSFYDTNTSWTEEKSFIVKKTNVNIKLFYDSNKKCYMFKEISEETKDSLANPDETLFLDIAFANTGSSNAVNATATLSTTSPYVSILNTTYNIGNILQHSWNTLTASGTLLDSETIEGSDITFFKNEKEPFKIHISKDCPDGETLPFTFKITDEKGNSWTDYFSIPVNKVNVNISVNDFKFSDGKTGVSNENYPKNNENNIINPGETIRFDIRLYNSGTVKDKNVNVTLSSTSNYIVFEDNNQKFDTILPKHYVTSWKDSENKDKATYNINTGYYSYKFRITGDTPANTTIPILVTITDKFSNSWTYTIKITVQ